MIVRRPSVDEREVVPEAVLDPDSGLVGDGWLLGAVVRHPTDRPTRRSS
jgi:hypothetical protein